MFLPIVVPMSTPDDLQWSQKKVEHVRLQRPNIESDHGLHPCYSQDTVYSLRIHRQNSKFRQILKRERRGERGRVISLWIYSKCFCSWVLDHPSAKDSWTSCWEAPNLWQNPSTVGKLWRRLRSPKLCTSIGVRAVWHKLALPQLPP